MGLFSFGRGKDTKGKDTKDKETRARDTNENNSREENNKSGNDKNEIENQDIGFDEIKRRWAEAYRANPHLYEKQDDDGLIASFALTEDTDSLFPYFPEKQWAVTGKEIKLWMITMVSLTNPQGGVIGQMEYHEAMKRLEPYILANADGWVFIRAMTHAELDALFEGLPRKLV